MIELIIMALIVLPVAGIWASYKLWRWHRFYGTRFLWGLFLASVTVDVAGLPIALLAIRRLVLGPHAPALMGTGEIMGLALILLEGIFVYLVFRWSDLDDDMKVVREGNDDEISNTNLPPTEERDLKRIDEDYV